MATVKRRSSSQDGKSVHFATNKRVAIIPKNSEVVSEDEEYVSDSDVESEEEEENSHVKINTTAQDIHIARETAELFKSNIFKLQIDELLEQVKIKNSHILKVEKFLHKLYDVIQQVPEWEEKSLAEVESYFKNKIVSVPFVDPKPNVATTKYSFNYKKPAVSLIGSFALKFGIYQPQGSSIDVLLTMPESLFEKKDFLNFRCLHKRSVYLAYFTHHLSVLLEKNHLSSFLQLEYQYLNNDPLLPMLTISTTTEKSKASTNSTISDYDFSRTKFSINIIIGFPQNIFDAKKLRPHKNNIRIALENSSTEGLPPTSLYNFSVLSSTTYEPFLKFLHKTKKSTESFKEACILGSLWLRQRGFSSKLAYTEVSGGFGTFEFSILMAALLNGGGVNGNKVILHGFSSYQLFKSVIQYLATMDLSSKGHLQFCSDHENDLSSKYVDEGFQVPTIFDRSTNINILSKMSLSSYFALQTYAKETMKMLQNVVQDQFANIFLTNINKFDDIKYDLCYDLHLNEKVSSNLISQISEDFNSIERVKFLTIENYVVHKITSILRYALGDRIKLIDVEPVGQIHKFPITKKGVYSTAHKKLNFKFIKVKLITNGSESEKLVTKGPYHLETPTEEAIKFKEFWGSKASLRKFKDGSITHCCIWQTSASDLVITEILKFAINAQLAQGVTIKNNSTTQFQKLLPLPNLPASTKTSVLSLASFFSAKASFDKLYKAIFQMKLPLSVKSLNAVGTNSRYTSLIQPVPFAYSNPNFFQDVILELETSQKWPDEITSLEKSKTAFLLKIQEQLTTEQGGRYKSFFTRDESIPYNLEITTLHILTPEGYGFKLRILTERDEVLYLRAIENARAELKPELEKTFLKFSAKYQASARHTRTIENLAHVYEFYSPVVRLFKKWLDAHLLFGHLTDELIELIAMKPFVESAPYLTPGSVENGFLKLLKFLSEWNWKDDALILDLTKSSDKLEESLESSIGANDNLTSGTIEKLSEKLTLSQYKTIQESFKNLRKGDPNGINTQFFVASKIDPSGILFSSDIPLPIATRITALAKVALNLIQVHGLTEQTIKLLFTPAVKDYDFVVYLKTPNSLKKTSGISEESEFKNVGADAQLTKFPKDLNKLSEKMDPTFHLVKYLNMKYKNSIIFSSHKYIGVNGGDDGSNNVITALIKPLHKKPEKFKVNMDANVEPLDKETVILNKKAIFHEIAAFGNDLVIGFDVN